MSGWMRIAISLSIIWVGFLLISALLIGIIDYEKFIPFLLIPPIIVIALAKMIEWIIKGFKN